MNSPITLHPPGTVFHIMAKPIGAICNLDCTYCYYLEKERLYPGTRRFQMADELLEQYIRQYIEAQSGPEINFAWQGGEPTLLGLNFFRRVVEIQQQYGPTGRTITNSLQTNGTLLDEEWCRFLYEQHFLIGLSLDGPREMHDRYRVDKGGKPTFDKVMHGLELLKQHGVEFNTLTVVNRHNSRHALEVYRFLKKHGSGFMQFIPLVERAGTDELLAAPVLPAPIAPDAPSAPNIDTAQPVASPSNAAVPEARAERAAPVTPWSVESRAFGDFLCAIFDEWVRRDVGQVFVQLFDVQLGIWMGLPAALCVFDETCGRALALEHNGDLYSCDHYVYPQYKLGNIKDKLLLDLANAPQQVQFGLDKQATLPRYCRQCEVRFACNGECPKHRFIETPDGEPGLNYLCAGYKKFFKHIDPYMQTMTRLLRAERPAADIMALLNQPAMAQPKATARPAQPNTRGTLSGRHQMAQSLQSRPARVTPKIGRNEPCGCGSGKKYKRCCGA